MDIYLSGPAVADLEALSDHALATEPHVAHALVHNIQLTIQNLADQYADQVKGKSALEEIGRIMCGRFALHYEVKEQRIAISRILKRHVSLSELS
jgi:hypothetical protein